MYHHSRYEGNSQARQYERGRVACDRLGIRLSSVATCSNMRTLLKTLSSLTLGNGELRANETTVCGPFSEGPEDATALAGRASSSNITTLQHCSSIYSISETDV